MNMFIPIKTYSVIDEVSDQMKKLILDGKLRPGDLFPTEFDLAKQLNVSRTVIRESKKSLIGMGLLEIRGKRTYVRDDTYNAAIGLMSYGFQLERGSLEELIEARKVIENETAALAASRATDEMIDKLKELLEKQKEAIESQDKAGFVASDLKWHSTIAEASGNRMLAKMVMTIHNMLAVLIATTLEKPQSDKDAYLAHKKVTEAIISRGSDSARRAMDEHLNHIQTIILKILSEKKLE
jgi:GntR family transcriptional regulator, transcriptional repressor for pyruvate dehydrogenase complex